MTKIRISKEFKFETAHALLGYDGLCKNIHGHSYKLIVTIIGSPNDDISNPKYGMVMDFGGLKKIVNNEIVNKLDHSLVLNEKTKQDVINKLKEMYERIITVSYQPTSENMIIDFVEIIKNKLPGNVKLYSVRLYETATSYAEWYYSDNE